MRIDHTRHVLQENAHPHGRLATAHLRQHDLQVIAHSATVRHVRQEIAHLAIVHHALPVTAHSVALLALQVVPVVQAVVDSIVVQLAVALVEQSLGVEVAILANDATVLTAKVQYAALMPPRAMARDVAKVRRQANQAR